eukprot:3416418-Alexandrium_andersonii.AAC.1
MEKGDQLARRSEASKPDEGTVEHFLQRLGGSQQKPLHRTTVKVKKGGMLEHLWKKRIPRRWRSSMWT